MQGSCLRGAIGFSMGLRIGCPGGGDALPGTSNRFVKREPSFNADYRGGVTCLYDTQLLGACLHASEWGGHYRPEAVRGMPDVPIAPPATGPQYCSARDLMAIFNFFIFKDLQKGTGDARIVRSRYHRKHLWIVTCYYKIL